MLLLDPTNPWLYAIVLLVFFIIGTGIPIGKAFFKKVELDKAGKWFGDAEYFQEQQMRLQDSFGRITGTLIFWKNQAAAYKLLNNSRILWSLVSGGVVPVLLFAYDRNDPYAAVFMVSLTTWTSFIVVVAYTLKAEEKYKGFRMVESAYYDLSRHLLDFPAPDAEGRKVQVDTYLLQVEHIRDIGRKVVETGSPPEFDFLTPLRTLGGNQENYTRAIPEARNAADQPSS